MPSSLMWFVYICIIDASLESEGMTNSRFTVRYLHSFGIACVVAKSSLRYRDIKVSVSRECQVDRMVVT